MTGRRHFVIALLGAGAASVLAAKEEPPGSSREDPKVHDEFPSHDPALVREVVAASHARIDRVRELVSASPALAKAAWDWGFGDWESALGAASHMGRRDIAELLIDHGARPNLFTFAMWGRLDVVKASIEAAPGIQGIPGPHGITLLQHARNGGSPAAAVVTFLEELGDADPKVATLEITQRQQTTYVGEYRFGAGEDDALEVLVNSRGSLAIRRGERFPRVLNRVEEHGFAPAGAPGVRVRFDVLDGKAVRLTVHDPEPLVTASRRPANFE